MSEICNKVKAIISTDESAEKLKDQEISDHIHSCELCQELIQAYKDIPSLIAEAPLETPSDETVAAGIQKVRNRGSKDYSRLAKIVHFSLTWLVAKPFSLIKKIASLGFKVPRPYQLPVAAAFCGVFGLAIVYSSVNKVQYGRVARDLDAVSPLSEQEYRKTPARQRGNEKSSSSYSSISGQMADGQAGSYSQRNSQVFNKLQQSAQVRNQSLLKSLQSPSIKGQEYAGVRKKSKKSRGSFSTKERFEPQGSKKALGRGASSIAAKDRTYQAIQDTPTLANSRKFKSEQHALRLGEDKKYDIHRIQKQKISKNKTNSPYPSTVLEETLMDENSFNTTDDLAAAPAEITAGLASDARFRSINRESFKEGRVARRPASTVPTAVDAEEQTLTDYFQERAQTKGHAFQKAEGYWQNNYLPGDPMFRALQAQFTDSNQADLETSPLEDLHLQELARQPFQPFDLPENSALSVYLHADTTGLEEEKRMLLQVGLKATERRSGVRPAMNLALVLDLTNPLTAAQIQKFRSLVRAFEKVKDIGDNFSLIVAGRPDWLAVAADEFRHGPITVALQELFENHSSKSLVGYTLNQAVYEAQRIIEKTDDPTAPLGSSAVIIATGNPVNDEATLSTFAHESAVTGITVSTVSLNQNINLLDSLGRIALAGQGTRRILNKPADAIEVAKSTLTDVSRVVARAVRLRIRLKPGVKLIRVLDSQKLNNDRAELVREAEKSIDLRIARNLGIEADRGDDEEGIQIVIPVFYSGDAHVFLLDIVAEDAGPISDVTVRYKDLVHLKNGIARSNLTLPRIDRPLGPLELNVVKNMLAYRLSQSLRECGTLIEQFDHQNSLALLNDYLALQKSVIERHQLLQRDPDLIRDNKMTRDYLEAITHGSFSNEERARLVASLQLSSKLKVNPKPISID